MVAGTRSGSIEHAAQESNIRAPPSGKPRFCDLDHCPSRRRARYVRPRARARVPSEEARLVSEPLRLIGPTDPPQGGREGGAEPSQLPTEKARSSCSRSGQWSQPKAPDRDSECGQKYNIRTGVRLRGSFRFFKSGCIDKKTGVVLKKVTVSHNRSQRDGLTNPKPDPPSLPLTGVGRVGKKNEAPAP